MRTIAFIITLFGLAGCAVGPDYSRPDLLVPNGFRMATDGETESIANLPWWDLLQDEELRRLIRVALAENKDLKRAVASVEEFQSRLLISKMDFAPKADVTANVPAFGRKANFLFPGFPNPIQRERVPYGSAPHSRDDMKINRRNDGRGVYFHVPNGHILELMTVG